MYKVPASQLKPDFLSLLGPISNSSDYLPKTMLELQPVATNTFMLFSQVPYRPACMLAKTYPGLDFYQYMQDFLHSGLIAPEAVTLQDLCYCEDLLSPLEPCCLQLYCGTGKKFAKELKALFSEDDPQKRQDLAQSLLKMQTGNEPAQLYIKQQLTALQQGLKPSGDEPVNLMTSFEPSHRFPPLLFIDELSWNGLFGAIHYLTEQGSIIASHQLLEAGALREASGGYLVINIADLLESPHIWQKLKASLLSRKLNWSEENKTSAGFFRPADTPIHTRVILWGEQSSIALFEQLEPELYQLAPLLADFRHELPVTQENINHYLGYLRRLIERENLPKLDRSALQQLLAISSRRVEHQQYISLDKRWLLSLLKESWFYSCSDGNNFISGKAIDKATLAQDERLKWPTEQSNQNIAENVIQLICSGEQIGQVIGLSVIEYIGFPLQLGEPIRITATTHMGEGDLADVERKAELAGNIHAKAIMIIQGYLTHKFSEEHQIPLAGNLVFEQSYHEIDGDSASLAGLIALLSSMASQPVNQSLAVTGAIDQFGHVQAVGGINEKIEGFFRLTKLKGRHHQQGVIIPSSNLPQLNLHPEIIDAVQRNEFTIYAIEHVDEAISLLMDIEAGNMEIPNSLFGIIHRKAQRMFDTPHASWWGKLCRSVSASKNRG